MTHPKIKYRKIGWNGPAIVLAMGRDSRLWLSWHGYMVMYLPGQVRLASVEEEETHHAMVDQNLSQDVYMVAPNDCWTYVVRPRGDPMGAHG